MRRITVKERRTRLARRHRLAASCRATDVTDATRSMVCLHGTDPSTVYLSARVRVEGMTVADLEHALYTDRSLVKHLAMRRTLFVFPRETMSHAQYGASTRVADTERRRLIRDVERAGLFADGESWLSRASEAVIGALSGGREATWSELRDEIPILAGAITFGEGRSWGGSFPIGSRVLTTLSAAGQIVRATNVGGWTASRPRWSLMSSWLGEEITAVPTDEAVAGLVARWLQTFGPGTEEDIKWWLGSTLAVVRRALSDVGASEVGLGDRTGYVLADDQELVEAVEPWAVLLPPLDPTIMGWFERDWYLGPYRPQLFDSAGNAGPTVWWNGKVVGGWKQNGEGQVVLQLLENVGRDGREAIQAEAEQLTEWLNGVRVLPRFPSPLFRAPIPAEEE